jgi:hypothetical protein
MPSDPVGGELLVADCRDRRMDPPSCVVGSAAVDGRANQRVPECHLSVQIEQAVNQVEVAVASIELQVVGRPLEERSVSGGLRRGEKQQFL